MDRCVLIAAVLCFAGLLELGNGHRILCVFPTPSISHQVVFRGLTLALNKRGHELVIVTPNPINDPSLKNYTEIDIGVTYESFSNIDFVEYRRTSYWYEWMKGQHNMSLITRDIFEHPEVRKLYEPDSGENFDLMLFEILLWPGTLALAQRFNVPLIGIASLGLTTIVQYGIGNPIMPSHEGNWELGSELSKQSSFWRRLVNFYDVYDYMYWYRTTYMAEQQALAKKYLGNHIADLSEIEKNISLVFVNQQGPISYSRPNLPNIIEIGGFHVSKQVMTLPKDLQKILDEATEGFIYVSLGSNVKSAMLSDQAINEFISAFSRLPYKVLWKFENDILPNKPDNVYIMKWFPQQAVLAHRNLKVFVYQGGLQSTEEAVTHAVPLVGFPVMGDQDMQVNKMVSLGVALKLEITAVDRNELFQAISTVATDPRYKQKMLNLRSLIEDRPHDPLENAVWWTEYVIRHKGAPHLRSSTVDQPWYQRQEVDIIAFISAVFVLCLGLLIVLLYISLKAVTASNVRSDYPKQKIK